MSGSRLAVATTGTGKVRGLSGGGAGGDAEDKGRGYGTPRRGVMTPVKVTGAPSPACSSGVVSRMNAVISASQTRSPSTVAVPWILAKPRRERSSRASRISSSPGTTARPKRAFSTAAKKISDPPCGFIRPE